MAYTASASLRRRGVHLFIAGRRGEPLVERDGRPGIHHAHSARQRARPARGRATRRRWTRGKSKPKDAILIRAAAQDEHPAPVPVPHQPARWLAAGHHTCPFTLQLLGDATLVPNAPTAPCMLQLGFLPVLLQLVFHAPTPWDLSKQEDLALQCALSLLPSPRVWQVRCCCRCCDTTTSASQAPRSPRSAARPSRRTAAPSTTVRCPRSSAACQALRRGACWRRWKHWPRRRLGAGWWCASPAREAGRRESRAARSEAAGV